MLELYVYVYLYVCMYVCMYVGPIYMFLCIYMYVGYVYICPMYLCMNSFSTVLYFFVDIFEISTARLKFYMFWRIANTGTVT